MWNYTPVGSSLARKYKTRMEVNRNTLAYYNRVTNTTLTSFIVQAPVLHTNIRLGRKWLTVSNAVVYCDGAVMTKKKFIAL